MLPDEPQGRPSWAPENEGRHEACPSNIGSSLPARRHANLIGFVRARKLAPLHAPRALTNESTGYKDATSNAVGHDFPGLSALCQ